MGQRVHAYEGVYWRGGGALERARVCVCVSGCVPLSAW